MGKKKLDEMAKHRAIFREGAARRRSRDVADEVFSLMLSSRATASTSRTPRVLAARYHTAWIKSLRGRILRRQHEVELDNSDKLKALLVDARTFG